MCAYVHVHVAYLRAHASHLSPLFSWDGPAAVPVPAAGASACAPVWTVLYASLSVSEGATSLPQSQRWGEEEHQQPRLLRFLSAAADVRDELLHVRPWSAGRRKAAWLLLCWQKGV